MTAVCVLIGVCFALWTVVHRRTSLVRSSQPGFLCAIVLGSLLSLSAVFPAALDHRGHPSAQAEDAHFAVLDMACNLQVSLYSVGFMITFTCILTKLWRITRLVNTNTIGAHF